MAIARQALQGARQLGWRSRPIRGGCLIKGRWPRWRVLLQCLQAPFGPFAVDPIDAYAIARQADCRVSESFSGNLP